MNRRRAREYALQVLFQWEFTGERKHLNSFSDLLKDRAKDEDIIRFAEELIRGTIEHIEEIDSAISRAAEHWDIKRMAAVDRNLLRLSVFELLYRKDLPPAVTINEALEIAKKYSSAESAPFINGLLDKIAKQIGKT